MSGDNSDSSTNIDSTQRLNVKKQTLDDAYAVPANVLEIDIINPVTSYGVGNKRFTDYEVHMKVTFRFLFIYNFEN